MQETSPNLLVVTLDGSGKRPHICDMILSAHPELGILAVSSAQNRSIFYWAALEIQSKNIEPSEDGILTAARNMATGRGKFS